MTDIEIIPGSNFCLTGVMIASHLKGVVVLDAATNEVIDSEEVLVEDAYTLQFRNKSYYLRKAAQDFDVSSPLEYLEAEYGRSEYVEKVSRDWASAGVSYYLSPDDKFDDQSESFVALIVALARATGGAILSIKYPWCDAGIYTGSQFWGCYSAAHDFEGKKTI